MKTTIPFTMKQVYKYAIIHYVILFMISTWTAILIIIINGMYIEYKMKKIMEQYNNNLTIDSIKL